MVPVIDVISRTSTSLSKEVFFGYFGKNKSDAIDRWRFVMFKELRILLLVPCLLFFAASAVAETLPMVSFNPPGVYAYDSLTETIDTVNNTMADMAMPDINPAQTLMVFVDTVGANNYGTIKVYDLAGKSTASIATVTALKQSEGGNVAKFTVDGKILFVDSADYKLKKINTDGDLLSLEVVALPPSNWQYTYFGLSPDRTKVAIITRLTYTEGVCSGPDPNHYACNYERLYVTNADGTGSPTLLTGTYLGDWNFISWKQDSQALLYYHHHFDGTGIDEPDHKPPAYTLFDLSGETPVSTEFSGGIWNTNQNVCVFTKRGNLLSLANQKLYNGETGALIADVSSTVPDMLTGGIVGWSITGEFYFANSDKSNFHQFIEQETLYADLAPYGLYKYDAGTWTQINVTSPASMAASDSVLYVDFAGYGLYKYDAGTWTQINVTSPASMAASGSVLYADLAPYGLYKYDAGTWTQINVTSPASMATGF
jgi:hypothetical protein